MSPSGSESIDQLLTWGAEHNSNCIEDVEIYEDAVTGLSFKATKSLPADSDIVNCSYQITLSYLNAIQSPGFLRRSEAFPINFLKILGQDDPNVIGYFFLMQQYIMKEESFWWPYIQNLPQPDNTQKLSVPVWWPEEDLKFLEGTNAGPPIQKRKDMWVAQWNEAISLLQGKFADLESYTYALFMWAATIFGSRSFRPSLTIAGGMFEDESQTQDHIRKDRFSILLPILDIGNHDGVNNVAWHPNKDTGLTFSNRTSISKGSQIYNFYGFKSNSELLVGYGFTLPRSSNGNFDGDSVNLKLKPSPQTVALRRQQKCHSVPVNLEEEFMYAVRKQDSKSTLPEFAHFPHGLLDVILAMIASQREITIFWSSVKNRGYCAGVDLGLYSGPLYRSSFYLLQILHQKLIQEITRLHQTDPGHPSNDNQVLAHQYRSRQLAVLESAIQPVAACFEFFLSTSSFCQHPQHLIDRHQDSRHSASTSKDMEILSLECAFDWLRVNYLELFNSVAEMIAEDQDEPLPLNWSVLVEDWDRTYWVVWIYIMTLIAMGGDGSNCTPTHEYLTSWVFEMQEYYSSDFEAITDSEFDAKYDIAEKETIDLMLKSIAYLPQFAVLYLEKGIEKHRNFASFLVEHETVATDWVMVEGQAMQQLTLCVRKITDYLPTRT